MLSPALAERLSRYGSGLIQTRPTSMICQVISKKHPTVCIRGTAYRHPTQQLPREQTAKQKNLSSGTQFRSTVHTLIFHVMLPLVALSRTPVMIGMIGCGCAANVLVIQGRLNMSQQPSLGSVRVVIGGQQPSLSRVCCTAGPYLRSCTCRTKCHASLHTPFQHA